MMSGVGMVSSPLSPRNPYIQVKAVLGQRSVRVPHLLTLEPREILVSFLVARVRQLGSVQHPLPLVHRHRPPEPQRTHRWLGKRYTRVHPHLAIGDDFRVPLHQARAGHHHRVLFGVVGRRPASATDTGTTGTPTAVRTTVGRRPAQDGRTTQQQRHRTGVNAVDTHFHSIRRCPIRAHGIWKIKRTIFFFLTKLQI